MTHERLLEDLRRLLKGQVLAIAYYRDNIDRKPEKHQKIYEELFDIESMLFDIEYKVSTMMNEYCDPCEISMLADRRIPIFCAYMGTAAEVVKSQEDFDTVRGFVTDWAESFARMDVE